MIQEPTDSTFNKKAATSAERWFTAKNKLLLTRNLTSRNFSNYRLSVNLPFPHFAPKKPSVTKYDFQWGNFTNFDMFYGLSNSRIWAENADLPTPKNELLKRANLKKPKNFALSHNAALSGEQRIPLHLKYCSVNTKDEANRKCRALGIRLKRLVIPLGWS